MTHHESARDEAVGDLEYNALSFANGCVMPHSDRTYGLNDAEEGPSGLEVEVFFCIISQGNNLCL